MTRLMTLNTTFILLMATAMTGWAEEACCPASASAPPSSAPRPGLAALPDGHPPLPAARPQTDGAMPEGHPAIGDMGATGGGPVNGNLVVKVKQGTPGGAVLTGAPLVIELMHRGAVLKRVDLTLDASGLAMVEDIELTHTVQPVVSMHHGGAEFRMVGPPMSPKRPDQVIQFTAYESTDAEPDWHVSVRHVTVQPARTGVKVTEMLVVQNPSDRAWRGAAVPVSAPKAEQAVVVSDTERVTLVLALPPRAMHLQLGQGFGAGRVKLEDGRLISSLPIVPGATRYLFAYMLPAHEGTVQLTLTAPAPVRHTMVMLPEGQLDVTVDGLELLPRREGAEKPMRVYQTAQMAENATATLTIRSAQEPTAAADYPAAAPTAGGGEPIVARWVAGVGGSLLLLGAVVVLFVHR